MDLYDVLAGMERLRPNRRRALELHLLDYRRTEAAYVLRRCPGHYDHVIHDAIVEFLLAQGNS